MFVCRDMAGMATLAPDDDVVMADACVSPCAPLMLPADVVTKLVPLLIGVAWISNCPGALGVVEVLGLQPV